MRTLPLVLLCCFLVGFGKAPPPYPVLPREGNATLSFENTSVTDFIFMPDGEKCGGYMAIPPELDPVRRADRTFVLEANKRSALQFVWISKFSGACWVILSVNPVADGRYRLDTGGMEKICAADVKPLDERSAEGFEVRRMRWTGFKVPSQCKPMKRAP